MFDVFGRRGGNRIIITWSVLSGIDLSRTISLEISASTARVDKALDDIRRQCPGAKVNIKIMPYEAYAFVSAKGRSGLSLLFINRAFCVETSEGAASPGLYSAPEFDSSTDCRPKAAPYLW